LCFIRKNSVYHYSITLHKLDRSFDDVAFAKFDRNSNLVPDYILPDIVARLRNQKNYSICRMYFIRDGIVDSLMEQ
jgi:hypothetical protein